MKKILVADDESSAREILSDFFTMTGFEVIEAENGEDAFDKFMHHNPDAAILDLQMPGMKGDEAAFLILEQKADFPIIILSGFLENHSVKDYLDRGIVAAIEKPVNLVQIKNIIDNIFNKQP